MAAIGISAALATPFGADGAIDTDRLAAHGRDLLSRGLDGLTLFGTTGENASIGQAERTPGIACLREAGIPAERLILGLCATAVGDVAAQVREGLSFGLRRFLLPPPFYFVPADDAALFDWHAEVFSQAGAEAAFVLYHIPQVTGVALSASLIARLAGAFPDRLLAIKDSSGDWPTARALLEAGDLPVLIGDERLLHRGIARGGAGAISGMANLHPERLARIVATAREDAALSEEVGRVTRVPVIPAIKHLLAEARADTDWARVRPPLAPLSAADRRLLSGAEARTAS